MVTHPAGRTDPKKWLSMRTFFSRGLDRKRNLTRMHSSRMRTARSSSRPGGLHQARPWDQTPNHTRQPPGSRHPPDQAPPSDQAPPGPGTPQEQAPPDQALHWDQAPPPP